MIFAPFVLTALFSRKFVCLYFTANANFVKKPPSETPPLPVYDVVWSAPSYSRFPLAPTIE